MKVRAIFVYENKDFLRDWALYLGLAEPYLVLGPSGTLWDVLRRSGTLWDALGRSRLQTIWDALDPSGALWVALGRSGSLWDVLGRSGAWGPYLGLAEPYLGLAEPYPGVAEPYPSLTRPKIKKNPGQKKLQFYVYLYIKKFNFSSPAPRSTFVGFSDV